MIYSLVYKVPNNHKNVYLSLWQVLMVDQKNKLTTSEGKKNIWVLEATENRAVTFNH